MNQKLKDYHRAYREKHKEHIRKLQHDWYLKNKEWRVKKDKEYRHNNVLKARAYDRLMEKQQEISSNRQQTEG